MHLLLFISFFHLSLSLIDLILEIFDSFVVGRKSSVIKIRPRQNNVLSIEITPPPFRSFDYRNSLCSSSSFFVIIMTRISKSLVSTTTKEKKMSSIVRHSFEILSCFQSFLVDNLKVRCEKFDSVNDSKHCTNESSIDHLFADRHIYILRLLLIYF